MEVPSDVLIHNDVLGVKGTRARLIQVSADGYYEAIVSFGDKPHRVLLPIAGTVIIAAQPESLSPIVADVER